MADPHPQRRPNSATAPTFAVKVTAMADPHPRSRPNSATAPTFAVKVAAMADPHPQRRPNSATAPTFAVKVDAMADRGRPHARNKSLSSSSVSNICSNHTKRRGQNQYPCSRKSKKFLSC
jgi:hypothetical protein